MELRVDNLPSELPEKELKKIFDPYGAVRAKIITDRDTGKSKGFGFVEIPANDKARRAVKDYNGASLKCNNEVKEIKISEARPRGQNNRNEQAQGGEFPYRFCRRKTVKKKHEKNPFALHDKLNDKNYDIAFEIEWKALTPAALNPCIDNSIPANKPKLNNNKSYFAGYNKRWLMIDDKLIISPFTVKSAIANGFANLMGGCYRVNTKKDEGHKTVEQGQYPYPGGYKRYRADMANSKPGIVEKPNAVKAKNDNFFEIKAVAEYYYDQNLPFPLKQHEEVYVTLKPRGNKPAIIQKISKTPLEPAKKVKYFGKYTEGMNVRTSRKHQHRFYSDDDNKIISGTISDYNFNSLKDLEQLVYMGQFNHDPSKRWFQDIRGLKAGEWVYYQVLNGKITSIGKNFQFKAIFFHEDAVPENSKLCKKKTCLCPRCRLFGMTEENQDNKESSAFRGRFKASALKNDLQLKPGNEKPFPIPDKEINETVKLKTWLDSETGKKQLAYQVLMPISGEPKPNKRDNDGYFNLCTGEIKGAKIYKHAKIKSADNIGKVNTDSPPKYTHKLRNYAMVCEPDLLFTGTVGAENCTPGEIAALVMLLDSSIKNHGFKLGLDKAFGMGSFYSAVKKVWIRAKEGYKWDALPNWKSLEKYFSIAKEIELIEKIERFKEKINSFQNMEKRTIVYPAPVAKDNPDKKKYWDFLQ
ncbi:RNA bidning domain-containing protein [Desulfonema limicola]|uniref:RNA bidning domain-containing protein n=1 Tax=Desulfonema limicola TaxID=45656 RepID=A0A975BAI2_9BACT|nr:hypothetical protein [Desulfonema limicola]QTA81757.1 RNA bidning domain-containing protein [Desulfonema limicola]